MLRPIIVSAFVLAGALALPAISYAQDSPSIDRDQSMVTDRDDDSGKWGWLGLLGLAGLMGLKRNDRADHTIHTNTRPV